MSFPICPTEWENKKVLVLTVDGSIYVGTLLGIDRNTNLTLSNFEQRAITTVDDEDESKIVPGEGIEFIRGDMCVMVGLVDEELDGKIRWEGVRGAEIGSAKVASG